MVVAPVRALLQSVAPELSWIRPVRLARGSRVDQELLVERLVEMGYRREYQVEHRGEVAVRGGIVDVYRRPPSNRCASTCGATRSTG